MKIAICDDEVQFINTTVALLEKWASKHHVDVTLYRFSNGDDLIRAHHTHCMDLIILDIIMPLLNGERLSGGFDWRYCGGNKK